MFSEPSVLNMSDWRDHHRICLKSSPLTAPVQFIGTGNSTSASVTAAQNAANAKRYVRLLPNGIAAPDKGQLSHIRNINMFRVEVSSTLLIKIPPILNRELFCLFPISLGPFRIKIRCVLYK